MKRSFHLLTWVFTGVFLISGCIPSNPIPSTTTMPAASTTQAGQPTALPPTHTLPPVTPTPAPAQPTPTPVPSETQALLAGPTLAPSSQLISIAMIDNNDGWGLSEGRVYRITNAGSHRIEVTPPGLVASASMLRGFFLNPQTAWVLVPDPQDNASATLFHTHDGGVTWQSAKAPFGSSQLQFLDGQNGWALSVPGAAAGSATAEIYHTADAGATWTKVFAIDPQAGDVEGGLPFAGMKNGLTFLDNLHGWVTGSQPMEKYTWLFMTADGGKTWQQQGLALPEGHDNDMLSIDPPRFFTPTDGLLPVFLSGVASALDFYTTRDGGATWASTTPVKGGGLYDFISMQSGWIWNETGLYATQDGGKTWSVLTPNLDLSGNLIQFDFSSSEAGWALAMDADGTIQLYKTEDGGKTWNLQ